MQSNEAKIGTKLAPPSRQNKKVGHRRAISTDGEMIRERARNLARAGTTSEQLRRVQELAQDKNDKLHEEEERRIAARAYAQKVATQEQLRRIEEDAESKTEARRESQHERQRNIELAVNLAEQERQRRMREDKQRSLSKLPDPLPSQMVSLADDGGFQFQHMSLGSPIPTVPTPPPFGSYSQSPSSPSSVSTLSPSGDNSPMGLSTMPPAPLPPVPASSPLFRAQSSSPEPAPPARKVRKTRTRGRSTNPIPRPDSPKMRRRARKNSRERQRRVELNDQFEKLSAMLSVDRKGKLRKTSILLEAISVIGTLRSENSRLRAQQQSAVPAIAVPGSNGTPSNKRSRVRPRSGSSQYPRPSTFRSNNNSSTSSPPSAPSFPSPRSSSPIPSGDGMLDDLPSDLTTLPIKRSQSYGTSVNNNNRSLSATPSTSLSHTSSTSSTYPLSPNYSAARSQPPSPMGFPYPLSNTYNGEHLTPFREEPIPPLVDSSLLNLDIDTNPGSHDITPFLLSPTSFSSGSSDGGGMSSVVAPSPVSSIASTISSTNTLDEPLVLPSTTSLTPTASSVSSSPFHQPHHPGRIPRSLTEDSSFGNLKLLHTNNNHSFNTNFNHDFDTNPFLSQDWGLTGGSSGSKMLSNGMDFDDPMRGSSHHGRFLTKLELEQPTIPITLTDMIEDTSMDSPRTIKLESPSASASGGGGSGSDEKHSTTTPSSNEFEDMETWDEVTRFDPHHSSHHSTSNLLLSGADTTFDFSFELSTSQQRKLTV